MFDALKISLIAFMFVILGEPGMIFAWYQKLIYKLPEMIYKPLGGCVICFAGQLSFWYFIFFKEYNLLEHLFFVSLTIFFTKLLSYLWNHLEQ
jgi:hypothetical protein